MSKNRLTSLWSLIRRGYDRRSLAVLGIVAVVYGAVAVFNWFLVDMEAEPDYLLGAIWTVMTLALLWDPQLRRDGKLILVGLVGGLVIEGWGTNTLLWKYFTEERPPLWILPAWPIAAISIDRLARLLDWSCPWLRRHGTRAYWLILPLFFLFFLRLMWPAITQPFSVFVCLLMLGVIFVAPRPDRDIVLFTAGAFMGIFLEYWGTSRHCWTYWSQQIPPAEAVLAHGFASIAFARGVQALDRIGRLFSAAANRRPATGTEP